MALRLKKVWFHFYFNKVEQDLNDNNCRSGVRLECDSTGGNFLGFFENVTFSKDFESIDAVRQYFKDMKLYHRWQGFPCRIHDYHLGHDYDFKVIRKDDPRQLTMLGYWVSE